MQWLISAAWKTLYISTSFPPFIEHYLLRCSNFIDERVTLFQTTRDFHPLNVNTLLFGGDGLSNEDNIRIFSAVQLFIKDSKRFAN